LKTGSVIFVCIKSRSAETKLVGNKRPETASDDDLVLQGRAGSHPALTELYRRHRPRVFGYALRMTGDRDLAEEIFCATFVTFFENLARYRPCGKLANYLLRIARNRLLDELQARSRLATPLPAPADTGNPTTSNALTPDEAVAAAELAGMVQRALADLPDHLREVVVLRLYEGLDYAAIGEIVGAGEPTVRSRMRYALETLRRIVHPIPDA
jgi:RNA polymerase sigma-70 factor, ECF subfamily